MQPKYILHVIQDFQRQNKKRAHQTLDAQPDENLKLILDLPKLGFIKRMEGD